jgi:hypothetical protein
LIADFQKEIVIATYVENPVTVWIQTITDENTAQLTNIMEQLVACCPAAPKVKGIPQAGKVITEKGIPQTGKVITDNEISQTGKVITTMRSHRLTSNY